MRIIKLVAVLALTVASYLIFLYFRIPFGIALLISMAIMWGGVKYVRKTTPIAEDDEEAGEEEEE
ncbi:MAG: hypothetical protein IKE52_04740 [Mogibacterium sp.]|nr:hypothetical protein [Mogibacterium sp.]